MKLRIFLNDFCVVPKWLLFQSGLLQTEKTIFSTQKFYFRKELDAYIMLDIWFFIQLQIVTEISLPFFFLRKKTGFAGLRPASLRLTAYMHKLFPSLLVAYREIFTSPMSLPNDCWESAGYGWYDTMCLGQSAVCVPWEIGVVRASPNLCIYALCTLRNPSLNLPQCF